MRGDCGWVAVGVLVNIILTALYLTICCQSNPHDLIGHPSLLQRLHLCKNWEGALKGQLEAFFLQIPEVDFAIS